jgi:hypothetical protein
MNTLHQEKTIPFTWKSWDMQDVLANSYYDVTFAEDFGVFKSGESFKSVFVDYGKGIVESYNEEGSEVLKTQFYKSIPTV